jgi:sarcosine oxidase
MMRTCDVAIVGLGIMGSAVLHNLAKRGVDVLGFDPLTVGEKTGSSHGSCRIYRRINFESPAYEPLSERAFEAWSRLEASCGQRILLPSILVEAGPPGSSLVTASREAGKRPAGNFSRGADINKEFPAFRLPDDWDVAVQNDCGILLAERAVRAFRATAENRIVNKAVRIERNPRQIILTTSEGTRYAADKLVLAVGPWITSFIPRLTPFVSVTRQVVGWFEPTIQQQVRYPVFPLFILDAPDGLIYGFPNFEGRGAKAASHNHGRKLSSANDGVQDATDADLLAVARTMRQFVPAAAGKLIAMEVCLYTNTVKSDVDDSKAEEFIIDRLPDDPRVIVASPCSGHGFKFASAIGEMIAEMAMDPAAMPSKEFRLSRYSAFRDF